MFRGTTPTLTFKFKETTDLTKYVQIWATLSDGVNQITKEITDLSVDNTEKTVSLKLTQEDTLVFKSGSTLKAQLRLLDESDNAYATKIQTMSINSILKDGVISGN